MMSGRRPRGGRVRRGPTRFLFLILSGILALPAISAQAQEPVSTGICVTPTYAGGDGRPHPCSSGGSSGSSRHTSGGNTYSGPSPAEIEAEREREAEKKRLEKLQQQMEQERLAREAEQKKAQEDFVMAVKKAAGELKGVPHDGSGLKGISGGNTAFFGLKGVSPNEAAANMKTAGPDRTSRDVSTASKQLTCAADITNYALEHVSSLVSGTGSQADLDEIKYLAGEAANALQGNPIGVQCNSSAALRFSKKPDLKTIAPAYKARLDKMIGDSQALYKAEQQAALVQQKIAETRKQVDELKAQRASPGAQPSTDSPSATKPASAGGDQAVDKAYAEQKAWQQKDREKINQVYEEQKKLQQQQSDALALLRKAQAEYNAVNSQKVSETKALAEDAKAIGELESGNAPQQ